MVVSKSLFILGSFVVACSAKVQRFPQPGEAAFAEAFTVEAGGKGLNLAVGARRLGAEVDGLLAVGDDSFADFAETALARGGLPAAMLIRHDGPTGSGVGFTDATGETCLAVHPGANARLSAADIAAAAGRIEDAGLVLAQFEIGDAPIVAAFEIARAAGATTILNPSPFRVPPPAMLRNTTILVVNLIEAAALFDVLAADKDVPASNAEQPSPKLLAALFESGPETLVVTSGAAGAFAYSAAGARWRQPVFDILSVDSLGAGDAFTAGLASGLAESLPFATCLRRAAACGALAAQCLGVFDALPDRATLDAFLSDRTQEAKPIVVEL